METELEAVEQLPAPNSCVTPLAGTPQGAHRRELDEDTRWRIAGEAIEEFLLLSKHKFLAFVVRNFHRTLYLVCDSLEIFLDLVVLQVCERHRAPKLAY